MIWLAIISFIAVLAWDIASDYRKWLRQKSVAHAKEAWLRCLLLIPSIVIFTIAHPGNSWWHLVYTLLMCFFVYWLIFDGIYNKLRGYDWWFTGSNDPDDAATDNFLQSIPKWLHILIKLGGVAGGVFLYFK